MATPVATTDPAATCPPRRQPSSKLSNPLASPPAGDRADEEQTIVELQDHDLRHDSEAAVDDTDDDTDDDQEFDDASEIDDAALAWIEGEAVQVTPESDPFTSTLSLISETEQLAVWVQLTPTVIRTLLEQLGDVLDQQHEALGIPPAPHGRRPVTDKTDDTEDDDQEADAGGDLEEDEERSAGEGRIRRARDPLGLRHIHDRSSNAVWYIAGAVVLLAVVAAILSQVNL